MSASTLLFRGNSTAYVSCYASVQGEQRCLRKPYRWKSICRRGNKESDLLSVTSVEQEKSINRYLLYTTDAYLLTDSVTSPRYIKTDFIGCDDLRFWRVANGLQGFLGCQSVLYEKELEQFFDTALVQDGDITGAVSDKFFSISQSRFAEVFDLPTEGLVYFFEVPKNLVYDARSIFSKSGVPISTHGKKRFMKYEYRLLNDILANAITVKAGSFDAVTNERFLMMTAIQFGLKGNDYSRSSCRLSIFVNRKRLPESIIDDNFVPHGCFIEPVQYWGASPSIIHSWGWYIVCIEVIRCSMFGCLRPVRDENLCRAIVAIGSVVDVLETLPTNFCSVVEQGQATDNFVCYFSDSDVQSELESTPEIDLVSSDGSRVYR
ncbi:hypothetical protein F511_26696 [Dorcoceras hygrometricum]|uniref:Uncharacterized protein n=1 Tax=Dorcoceras hygrometricum TaxID=472368 RepID=A0A2Z7BDW6_9LAMI|nr:hypothetical protein F511_26696 [Dorcoceras hygrometricum]